MKAVVITILRLGGRQFELSEWLMLSNYGGNYHPAPLTITSCMIFILGPPKNGFA